MMKGLQKDSSQGIYSLLTFSCNMSGVGCPSSTSSRCTQTGVIIHLQLLPNDPVVPLALGLVAAS